jgi:hypothetical protein
MSSRITSAIVMLLSWEVGRDLEKTENCAWWDFGKLALFQATPMLQSRAGIGLTESSTASLSVPGVPG